MRISDWSSDVCSSDLSWSGIPRTWIVDDGCLRATRASEAFACRQVAPRPDGQPGQRNPADADAPDCHHVKAHLRARVAQLPALHALERSEEHTSEIQHLMRISYAVFCLKKTKNI